MHYPLMLFSLPLSLLCVCVYVCACMVARVRRCVRARSPAGPFVYPLPAHIYTSGEARYWCDKRTYTRGLYNLADLDCVRSSLTESATKRRISCAPKQNKNTGAPLGTPMVG